MQVKSLKIDDREVLRVFIPSSTHITLLTILSDKRLVESVWEAKSNS